MRKTSKKVPAKRATNVRKVPAKKGKLTIRLDATEVKKALDDFLKHAPPGTSASDVVRSYQHVMPGYKPPPAPPAAAAPARPRDPDIGKRITELNGSRHNTGKPRLSLVVEAREAIEGAAQVLGHGLVEYGRGNWRKGLMRTEVIDSLLRHATAYAAGEDIDPKTGKPHVDFITCNALFLGTLHRTHPHLDDRTIIDGVVVGDATPQK